MPDRRRRRYDYIQSPYFIWPLSLFTSHTVSHGGRQPTHRRRSNLPWVGVQFLYFSLFQLISICFSPHIYRTRCTCSSSVRTHSSLLTNTLFTVRLSTFFSSWSLFELDLSLWLPTFLHAVTYGNKLPYFHVVR